MSSKNIMGLIKMLFCSVTIPIKIKPVTENNDMHQAWNYEQSLNELESHFSRK